MAQRWSLDDAPRCGDRPASDHLRQGQAPQAGQNEAGDDRHQAVNGEPAKVGIADAAEVRRKLDFYQGTCMP